MWKICRIWVEEFTHLDRRSFSSIWNPQLLNTDISMTQNFWWTCLNVVVTGAHAGASDSAGTAWAYLLKCLYQGWITEVHSQQIWHKRSQSNTFFPQIAHFTRFSLACLLCRRIKHKSEFNRFPFMARWWAPNTSTFIMSDEGKTDFPSVGVSEHIILCVGFFFFPFSFFPKSSKSAYLCLFHLPIWLACSLARPPV